MAKIVDLKSICSRCNRVTNQKVLVEKEFQQEDIIGSWWEAHKYQIIQCRGCDLISFRKLYCDPQIEINAEHLGIPSEEAWSQDLYPKRTLNTLQIKNLLNTPLNIKKIYRETIDAFNYEQKILCSAGLRAIVEGICNDKKIKKGEITTKEGTKRLSSALDGKIEGLSSMGFLTSSNAKILHDLRFLGNEAIHSLEAPSIEELKLAIHIIEHTIENIYELHHKAEKLRDAKTKRSIKK